jgi:DNA-directed RNA polymerase alpha subunit/DNA-directed RNA polymerase subunit L
MVIFSNLQQLVPNKKVTFTVKDSEVATLNALRRTILSDIPTIGFHFDVQNHSNETSIRVLKNTSPLHNEYLAHRVSLIPLCFHPDENFYPGAYKFTLKKKNTTSQIIDVTTDDFEIYNEDKGDLVSDSRKRSILPHDRITKAPILIAQLKPNLFDLANGDEIVLEAHPEIGTARKSASFSPVSLCTYEFVIDEDEAKKVSKKLEGTAVEEFETLGKYKCYKKNKYGEPTEAVFKIESETAFTPEFIFFKAFDVLLQKVSSIHKEFQTAIANKKTEIVEWSKVGELYQLVIKGETHTFGNLFQTFIIDRHLKDQGKVSGGAKLAAVPQANDEEYAPMSPDDPRSPGYTVATPKYGFDDEEYAPMSPSPVGAPAYTALTPDYSFSPDDNPKSGVSIQYIGYTCPHPLESIVVFRLKFAEGTKGIEEFIAQELSDLYTKLYAMAKDWSDFSKIQMYTDVMKCLGKPTVE